MIPDALVSCGYLLLGSGCCIYRLIKYSNDTFAKLLPQFVIASVGIATIGGRSLHALVYNIFWRSYPIDPRLIAKELQAFKNDKNIVDWILRRAGVASLVYSFYYHYGFVVAGTIIVVSMTLLEVLCFKEEIFYADEIDHSGLTQGQNTSRRFSAIVRSLPYPVATFWIISSEFLGRMVENNFCRLANVPFAISIWAFPPQGFYKGWSITDTTNDYMMLCYIILMTEGLSQTPIAD